MWSNLELFYSNKSEKLDIVLHGSRQGMNSNFIQRIYQTAKQTERSIVVFNFPYIDRGEEKLMNSSREEEKGALRGVLEKFGTGFGKIRLIGKSLGAVVAAEYLSALPEDEQRRFELIVLGYDLGWIDVNNFVGKITVIQGSKDPYGDIDDVRKDLKNAKSKRIVLREIGGADHSFNDPQSNEPKYVERVLKLLFTNYKVEKEGPLGASKRGYEIEPVIQKFDYDCGPASVGSLLLLTGKEDLLKTDIYLRLGVTSEGTKPKNIKRFFEEEKMGFIETFGSSINDLRRILSGGYACLVAYQAWGNEEEIRNLESGHYSVVFDMDDEYVWLIDPSVHEEVLTGFGVGIRKIAILEFDMVWKDQSVDGEIYDHWMIAVKDA